MSPISTQIETLAKKYGVPVLETFEFWLERASIREFEGGMSRADADSAALSDTETWAKLYNALNRPETNRRVGGRP